jgi:hypothetical protein
MTDFTKQLKAAQRKGRLTVADLARFFGRSHKTVREWTAHARQPSEAHARLMLIKLIKLELLIQRGELPPDIHLKKRERAAYMTLLGEGKLGRARILAAHSATERLDRRLGHQGGKTAPGTVRGRRRAAGVGDPASGGGL